MPSTIRSTSAAIAAIPAAALRSPAHGPLPSMHWAPSIVSPWASPGSGIGLRQGCGVKTGTTRPAGAPGRRPGVDLDAGRVGEAQARLRDLVLVGLDRRDQGVEVGVQRAERGHRREQLEDHRPRRARAPDRRRRRSPPRPGEARRRGPAGGSRSGSTARSSATVGRRSPASTAASRRSGLASGAVRSSCCSKPGSSSIVARSSSGRPATVPSVAAPEPISPATSSERTPRSPRAVPAVPRTTRSIAPRLARRRVELRVEVLRERRQVGERLVRLRAAPGDAEAEVDRRLLQRLAGLRVEEVDDLEQIDPGGRRAADRVLVLERLARFTRIELEIRLVDDRVDPHVGLGVLRHRPELGLRDVRGDGGAAVLAVGLDLRDQPGELAADPHRLPDPEHRRVGRHAHLELVLRLERRAGGRDEGDVGEEDADGDHHEPEQRPVLVEAAGRLRRPGADSPSEFAGFSCHASPLPEEEVE